MSKHTPGPWELKTVPTSIGKCHKIGPFNACIYVDNINSRKQSDEEMEANARLIAAAPELLEAAKLAFPILYSLHLDNLADIQEGATWSDMKSHLNHVVATLSDAITKSEGKEAEVKNEQS